METERINENKEVGEDSYTRRKNTEINKVGIKWCPTDQTTRAGLLTSPDNYSPMQCMK